MKFLPLCMLLAAASPSYSQELPSYPMDARMVAEHLGIEAFELTYEPEETTKRVNISAVLTVFGEDAKPVKTHDLAGVGLTYNPHPDNGRHRMLFSLSPEKSTLFLWDKIQNRFVPTALADGWKKPMEKVESNSGSWQQVPTVQNLTKSANTTQLRTWTFEGKKVAEVTLTVTFHETERSEK